MLRSLESLRLLGPLSPPPRELLRSELPPSAQQFGGQRTGVSRTSGPSPCPYSPESLEGKIPEVRTLPSPGLTSMSVVGSHLLEGGLPGGTSLPPGGQQARLHRIVPDAGCRFPRSFRAGTYFHAGGRPSV